MADDSKIKNDLAAGEKGPDGRKDHERRFTMFDVGHRKFGIRDGKIVSEPDREQYRELKQALVEDLAQSIYRDFEPKIRFIDEDCTMKIGYAYNELLALLPRDGKALPLLNRKHSPYLRHNVTMYGFEPFAAPQQGQELVKPGETRAFAYNLAHPGFRDAVRQLMDNPPPRDYCLAAPRGDPNAKIIAGFAAEAHAASKPLRLVVGESSHMHAAARRLIMHALPAMKASGAALCLEHFFYDTQQEILDRWIVHSSSAAPMPLLLERYAEYLDREFGWLFGAVPTGFKDLLRDAKRHGVRVVALDTEAVRAEKSGLGGHGNRILNMNYVAAKIIAEEIGNGGFVALVGGAHGGTYDDANGRTTPGLDRLCNAVSLLVDQKEGASPSLRSDAAYPEDKDRAFSSSEKVKTDFLFTSDLRHISIPSHAPEKPARRETVHDFAHAGREHGLRHENWRQVVRGSDNADVMRLQMNAELVSRRERVFQELSDAGIQAEYIRKGAARFIEIQPQSVEDFRKWQKAGPQP